jgi:hypothetical protein
MKFLESLPFLNHEYSLAQMESRHNLRRLAFHVLDTKHIGTADATILGGWPFMFWTRSTSERLPLNPSGYFLVIRTFPPTIFSAGRPWI